MQTSTRGRDFIKSQEGEVLHAYRDAVGVLTIGYGHTSAAGAPKVVSGMRITRDQADTILRDDLARVYDPDVAKVLGPTANQQSFDGASSFHFNTGAIRRASWVGRWRSGDRDGTRQGLKAWNKAGGRVLAGLTRRRSAEADIILLGAYPGGPVPNTLPVPKARLVQGDDDPDVVDLQKQLAALGYPIDPSGTFGPKTDAAIRKFQKAHPNLIVDGIAGKATKAAIQRELDLLAKSKRTTATGVIASGAAAGTLPAWAIALVVVASLAAVGYILWSYRDELKARFTR